MARILVLEDEAEIRSLMREALEADGHAVKEAVNGMHIEESVADYRPDIVITDLLMRGRDGFEAITALRRQYPALRILAVSGGGGAVGVDDALGTATKLGADATLAKPFRIPTLIGAIAYLMGRPASAREQARAKAQPH